MERERERNRYIVLNALSVRWRICSRKSYRAHCPKCASAPAEILNPDKDENDPIVMMLRIRFALERQQIQGYLAFILDMSALQDLREQIRLYISRLESGCVPDGM
ncbi:hypothetical protein [Kosakonia radicincitans]|uniref:hypothetical protein n=1 Tax=Kosakonia radicincitans TaxID=283686 RepID=UPI001D079C93|nr:hypothetical protein [Kosakonia radicincitans]